MKKPNVTYACLIVLFAPVTLFMIYGCGSTPEKVETFEVGDPVVPPAGCQILRKQIEEYNRKHGTNRVADC